MGVLRNEFRIRDLDLAKWVGVGVCVSRCVVIWCVVVWDLELELV